MGFYSEKGKREEVLVLVSGTQIDSLSVSRGTHNIAEQYVGPQLTAVFGRYVQNFTFTAQTEGVKTRLRDRARCILDTSEMKYERVRDTFV